MKDIQINIIRFTNGDEISYQKSASYFEKARVIDKIEQAKEDDVLSFEVDDDDVYLIPKKNILFVRIASQNEKSDVDNTQIIF